jgi:ATP-binding cassette subfamily G (WHITE) protein 2 (SNQ2)
LLRNLDYTVDVKGGKRQLLDKVQGYTKPGQLVALMGASGAGKTTLLDVLALRKDDGVADGELKVDGRQWSSSLLSPSPSDVLARSLDRI